MKTHATLTQEEANAILALLSELPFKYGNAIIIPIQKLLLSKFANDDHEISEEC